MRFNLKKSAHVIAGLMLAVASVGCTIDEDHFLYTPIKRIVINPIEAVITTQVLVAHDPEHVAQEPELMEYLHDFVEEAAENGIDISHVYDQDINMMFGDWSDSFMSGLSTGYKVDNQINIYIHERAFNRKSELKRKVLLYHELGHDIFNMKHGDNKILGPASAINTNNKDEAFADFWKDAKRR